MTSILRVWVIALALLLGLKSTALCEDDPAKVAGSKVNHGIDQTSRFIFYSVLEGLYEDGLSNEDVDRILLRKDEKSNFYHFIYACPICTATIWGLQAYRARPEQFYSLKLPTSTFGPGLSPELHRQLYSDDSDQRLIAINTLVQKWIVHRIDRMNLPAEQRAELQASLEKMRKQGTDLLKGFRAREHGDGLSAKQAAPAYEHLDECASCNGAVGQIMKIPDAEKKTR